MTLSNIKKELAKAADKKQAQVLQRFFKTGKGQYGEGDIFLGIKVPMQRKICSKYDLDLSDIQKLLDSKIHEHRLCALFMLVKKYERASNETKKDIYKFYLKNTKNINNWDLVDLSTPHIVGHYLLDKDRKILYTLAKSRNLWERRIAMLATFTFIRNNEFLETVEIAEILLKDNHDLIHKAVGWMLREMGKRDQSLLEHFLDCHSKDMPRTTLRYSIERLDKKKKEFYMKK